MGLNHDDHVDQEVTEINGHQHHIGCQCVQCVMIGDLADVIEGVLVRNDSITREDRILLDVWMMRGRSLIGDVPGHFDLNLYEKERNTP